MDSSQWPPGIGVVQPTDSSRPVLERKARPQNDQPLNCPRCNSTNTKFCYYNNYNLSQPRYLCKTCKRNWTHGGTLRNVPVGGGSRKNKRPSSSSLEASSKKLDLTSPSYPKQNPHAHEGQDVKLAYQLPIGHQIQGYNSMSEFGQVPFSITDSIQLQNLSVPSQHLSDMELLKTAGTANTTMDILSSSGYPGQQFKNGLRYYCLDKYGNGRDNLQETSGNTGRMLFPVEELKEDPTMKKIGQNREQGDSNEIWDGMLNGLEDRGKYL